MSMGEVDFGLWGVIGGLTAFISFLNGLMGESITRFYAYSVGEARCSQDADAGLYCCQKWFSIAVIIHTILPVVLIVIGYPCGIWAIENWLVIPPDRVASCIWVWRCVCASCFCGMVSVPFRAMYTAKQEIAELTIYSFVGTTVYVGLSYVMTLSSRDWLVYYAIITCLITVVPELIISIRGVLKYKECRFNARSLCEVSSFGELFKYAGLRFFGALSQLLTAQGIALSINKMLGPAKNAAMAIGTNLSGKAQTLTMSIRSAMQPAITNATGEGDDARANSLSFRTCVLSALGVWLFAGPLILEVDEVMILWLKNPPDGAVPLCRVLLLALFVDNLTIGHVMRVFATGKITSFQVAESVVWLSALVVALGWFFCGGGIVGVGVGYLVMYTLDNIVKLYCARKVGGMGVRWWFSRVALPVVGVAIVSAGVGLIPVTLLPRSFMRLMLTTFVCEIVFLPLVWHYVLSEGERVLVKGRLRNVVYWGRYA